MIVFPVAADPALTVVMVTWGSAGWVTRSLGALVDNTRPPYEVVIVDNASADGTVEILDTEVGGATVVRNRSNLGFGVASNVGALHARAPLVCFLNPDAFVPAGWAEPILRAFEDPSVAAVGPMLLNPDGTVQEAGVVVSGDGHPIQFGHGDPPSVHAANRRAPAVSGACMTVRASDFEAAGGFDPLYHPAYNEDVDLCLTLRHVLGRDVLYCSEVRVPHVGQTSVRAGRADGLMARHSDVLRDRWSPFLSGVAPLTELLGRRSAYWAARDSLTVERVLVLEPTLPQLETVAGLAARRPDVRVTVAGPTLPDDPVWAAGAGAAGIEVAAAGDLGSWLDARRAHYTVVATPAGRLGEENESVVRSTQPGADWVDVAGLEGKLPARSSAVAPALPALPALIGPSGG